jgi:hypothetical protein
MARILSTALPFTLASALSCLFALSGCASDPTLGEQLVERGQTDVDLGKQWLEGQKLIEEGQEDIEEGSEQLKEGEEKVRRGKQLVHEVERLRGSQQSGS